MIFRGCVRIDAPFLFGKKLSKNSFNNLPKVHKNNTDLCIVIRKLSAHRLVVTSELNYLQINIKKIDIMNPIIDNQVDNIIMGANITELKREKKHAEELLQSLKNRGADKTVIKAQQEIVEVKNKQYDDSVEAERQAQEKLGNSPITFEVVDEATGDKKEVSKKIAYVVNNRPIDNLKVDKFIVLISNGKYESAYPTIVADAKTLIAAGYESHDIRGNKIAVEEANDYFVILDGQHRGMAFAKLIAAGKDYKIPNTHVRSVENVGEYLVDINCTGTSWSNKDRLVVAALTAGSHKDLFANIAGLINEGFNPSTSSIIFTGKKLSNNLIKKALKGDEVSLPKDAKVNIERGNKFVTLCKAANIPIMFATKRYFIDGFNSYATMTSDDEAFEALDAMKKLELKESKLKEVKNNDSFITLLKKAAATDKVKMQQ